MVYPLENRNNVHGFPLIHYSSTIPYSDYSITSRGENKSILEKIAAYMMPLNAHTRIGTAHSVVKIDQISQTLNALIQGIILLAASSLFTPAVGIFIGCTGGYMTGYNGAALFQLDIDGYEIRQIIERNLNYYLPQQQQQYYY